MRRVETARAVVNRHANSAELISHHQVGLAVAGEIANRKSINVPLKVDYTDVGERAGAAVEQDAHLIRAVGGDDVGKAV